jgi:hypothetical protein
MLPADLLRKLRKGGDDSESESAQKRRRQDDLSEQPQPPHNANIRNDYGGWRPPTTVNAKGVSSSSSKKSKSAPHPSPPPHVLDRIPMAEMSPKIFFQRYVAARKPVVLTGGLAGTQWEKAGGRWTDAFLAQAAGDAEVRVEVRGRVDEPYGIGKYEIMKFGKFMERFAAGDERCYLTASPSATDVHGRPQVGLLHSLQLPGGVRLDTRTIPAVIN